LRGGGRPWGVLGCFLVVRGYQRVLQKHGFRREMFDLLRWELVIFRLVVGLLGVCEISSLGCHDRDMDYQISFEMQFDIFDPKLRNILFPSPRSCCFSKNSRWAESKVENS
jgi:hypothetical protein